MIRPDDEDAFGCYIDMADDGDVGTEIPRHGFTPSNGSVRLTIIDGEGRQASVGTPGSNMARFVGVISVQVFTAGGEGTAARRALEDAICDLFRNADIGAIRCGIAAGAGTPLIRSLNLTMTNNLRQQAAVGSLDAVGIESGRFEVTGSLEAYFRSGALLKAYLDHDDLGLEFTLGTEANSRYRFTIPTLILTGSPGAMASANDDDVMATMDFTAVLDRTSGSSIGATVQIERGV